jgi:hypothetical protein
MIIKPNSTRAGRNTRARLLMGPRRAADTRRNRVLPGKRYPDLVNDDAKLLENSFLLPDEALRDVPQPLWAGES